MLETFFLLFLIAYFILYLQGRKYLENFLVKQSAQPATQQVRTTLPPEKPYLRTPIDSLDEYELSAVFQRQGSKEASKKQINDAMTRYPMDWSVQGPASQEFQERQEEYEAGQRPAAVEGFSSSDPKEMMLPDQARQEEEERKILQTYRPEKSANLLTYSVDDVKTLVEKVYSKKGLIPELVPSTQGTNIWEIIDVKEKNPKIVWEDEVPMTEREKMTARQEETINVPYTVSDVAAGLDPFFQKGRSVRDGRYEYNQWTPGLERMFAPTQPVKAWY